MFVICCLSVRRYRLDRLCATRSPASVYSDFRFPEMPRGPMTQYPLTTTTNTATTTTTTLAAKSNDLDSCAASYASVGDVKADRKPETTSGESGHGNGSTEDVGCYWVVSPGWKLRRRGTEASETSQLPVAADRKSNNGDDKASSGSPPEYADDMRSHSAQGNYDNSNNRAVVGGPAMA